MRAVLVLISLAGLSGCRLGFDSDTPDMPSGVDDGGMTAVDAMRSPPPGDAGVCVEATCNAAGGSCVAGACELTATDESVASCPPGMPCRLVCNGYRFCRDGATCAGSPWCEVECIGYRACQYGVTCGSAQCRVTCNGEEACETGISVDAGGTCEASCCGLEACSLGTSTCVADSVCE